MKSKNVVKVTILTILLFFLFSFNQNSSADRIQDCIDKFEEYNESEIKPNQRRDRLQDCIEYMSKSGDPRAVRALIDLYESEKANYSTKVIILQNLMDLADIDNVSAQKEIFQLYGKALRNKFRENSISTYARIAGESLVKSENPLAMEQIEAALNDRDARVRRAAVSAIINEIYRSRWRKDKGEEQVVPPRLIDLIKPLLSDPDARVRSYVLLPLAQHTDLVTKELLLRYMNDEADEVRAESLSILSWAWGGKYDKDIMEEIIGATNDESAEIRKRALNALLGIYNEVYRQDHLGPGEKNAEAFAAYVWMQGELWESTQYRWFQSFTDDPNPVISDIAKRAVKKFEDPFNEPPQTGYITGRFDEMRSIYEEKKGEIGDAADIDALIEVTNSDDAKTRCAVAWALGDQGTAEAFCGLVKLVDDEDPLVRECAYLSLGRSDDFRRKYFLKGLQDENEEIRQRALSGLVELRDPVIIDHFADILKNSQNDRYKKGVMHTLEITNIARHPRIMECIVDIAKNNDEDSELRMHALRLMGKFGESDSVYEILIRSLRDDDPGMKKAAAQALGEMKVPASVKPLADAAEDRAAWLGILDAFKKKKDEKQRDEPRNDGDRRRLERERARRAELEIEARVEAIRALEAIGDSRAVKYLIRLLNDEHWDIRENAAQALGTIGDPRAVNPLLRALDDPDYLVRQRILETLGEINDPDMSIKPLISRLRETEPDHVREAALGALEKMTGQNFGYDMQKWLDWRGKNRL